MSDNEDKKTTSSQKKKGFFGDYVEHRNKDGGVTGTSHKQKGIFGDYTEHRNKDGGVSGTSHERTGILGKYTEHQNTDGGVTGTTYKSSGSGSRGGGGAISGSAEGVGGCLGAIVILIIFLWLTWGNISRKYEKIYPDFHIFTENTSQDELMTLANLEFTYWFLDCIDGGGFFVVYESCADEVYSTQFYFNKFHGKSVKFVEKQKQLRLRQLPNLLKAAERECRRKTIVIGTANYHCVQYRFWKKNIFEKGLHNSSTPVRYSITAYSHRFHLGPFLPIQPNKYWKVDERNVGERKKQN